MLKEWSRDLALALGFLTRLPITLRGYSDAAERTRALRAYPLAGLLIGLAGGAIYALAIWLSLPPLVSALLALATMMKLTGALHEDGLADMSDALGAPVEQARRLEIMRDSRIGSYGVLALVLAVALKAVVLAALAAQSVWLAVAVIVAAAAVSRVAPAGMMHLLMPARGDGLSAAAGRPARTTVIQALTLATLISVLALWPVSLLMGLFVVPLSGLVGLLLVTSIAQAQIGGQTGDVAGASQVVSELAILIAAIMVLTP